ncbi:MAG TPA: hypothetical protein VMF50_07150 [Candidatus Binataceae bacterium]|nr:hypothetical protein [Candidatus Binataceae bacterium]
MTIASTLALAAMMTGFCGCAENPFLQSGPEPRVANCALIKQATPSLYACNGKTYTATQLTDIRDGKTPLSN